MKTSDDGPPDDGPDHTADTDHTSNPDDHRDYLAYLNQRTAVKQRLDAYEDLVGGNTTLIHPLRTLLKDSSAGSLRSDERNAILTAIDNRIQEGTRGIALAPAGRITIVANSFNLPLAILNSQPVPTTVAVELDSASDAIGFPVGNRKTVRLDPGRNRLSIPVKTATPMETVVNVTITTPGPGIPMVLSTGRRSIRFVRLSGVGTMLSLCASLGVAVWWARNRGHRRAEAPPVLSEPPPVL